MSFIEVDGLGNVKEPTVHPEGPAQLRVIHVGEPYNSPKSGRLVVQVMHEIEEAGDWQPVNHYLTFPMEGDEDNTKSLMMLGLARYLHAAGAPMEGNGFDPNDLNGLSFQAYLIQSEPNDNGDVFNNIKLPRLPNED